MDYRFRDVGQFDGMALATTFPDASDRVPDAFQNLKKYPTIQILETSWPPSLDNGPEAAERRRAQIAQESDDLAAQQAQGTAQHASIAKEIADLQSRLHDEWAQRDATRDVRAAAEAALARSREQLRSAERAAQEAGYAERSCRDRLAEIARRREGLVAQVAQQQGLLGQLTSERASIDWTPVEEALQRQLAARGAAEQALADARSRQEALTAELVSQAEVLIAEADAAGGMTAYVATSKPKAAIE